MPFVALYVKNRRISGMISFGFFMEFLRKIMAAKAFPSRVYPILTQQNDCKIRQFMAK